MFILDKNKFSDRDLINTKEYIEFWKQYYKYAIKDENGKVISYIDELNSNNNLTEQNVKRLLRWKDSHMLTEKIRSGSNEGGNNERVKRVLDKFNEINDFRVGKISENDFKGVTENIFGAGIVWRTFLFHIARPHEYPIADQNVFRVFFLLKGIDKKPEEADWNDYNGYKTFFNNIAESDNKHQKNIREVVEILKHIDDALFEFGKFLKKYNS